MGVSRDKNDHPLCWVVREALDQLIDLLFMGTLPRNITQVEHNLFQDHVIGNNEGFHVLIQQAGWRAAGLKRLQDKMEYEKAIGADLGPGCHLELTLDGKGQIDGRLQVTRPEWSHGHNLSG